jgi:drug/metabolite transporter (DMT)-like permease
MNLKSYEILPVLFLHAIFPLIFSIGKAGMHYAPFSFFIALRALSCGLFSMGFYLIAVKKKKGIKRSDLSLFFQAGLFGIYLTFIPEFWSLQYLPVGKVAFLFVLAPFFTAFFSRMHGLETFSYKKIAGLTIGLIGFLPMLIMRSSGEVAFKQFFAFDLPELVLMFAVACYAYSWIAVKRLINKEDYSPWLVSGVSMLEGGVAALVTSFFYDGWYKGVHPVTAWVPLLWYIFLLMSVAITCFVLYIYLLKEYSPTLVSFFGFTRSFFGAFYGWILLGEKVPLVFYPSVLVVSFGLYLFYQEELVISKT